MPNRPSHGYVLCPFDNPWNKAASGWYACHKGRPYLGPFKTRREADAAALQQHKAYTERSQKKT
jgi:hypothetical protein